MDKWFFLNVKNDVPLTKSTQKQLTMEQLDLPPSETPEDTSEHELNVSLHPFNNSTNQTILEKDCSPRNIKTNNSCDGSDSGVEIFETAENIPNPLSLNPNNIEAKSVTPTPSVDSSILSCCSNYDDAYNLLVGRNSTLIEGYKVHGTSENGSESSSVKSAKVTTEKNKRRVVESKKKVLHEREPFKFGTRSNSSARSIPQNRGKSTDRTNRTNPSRVGSDTRSSARSLTTSSGGQTARSPSLPRAPSTQQQTDDGRWPSKNSKPAPLMTRSMRGILSLDGAIVTPTITKTVRVTNLQLETKNTLEKYATLPRRRKVQEQRASAENLTKEPVITRSTSIRRQVSTDTSPPSRESLRSLPPFHSATKKRISKTRIFHEISVQTILTQSDISKALDVNQKGETPKFTMIQKETVDVQTDCCNNEEIDKLQAMLKDLSCKFDTLKKDYDLQKTDLENTEKLLSNERLEKEGLKNELKSNSERVFAILGCDNLHTDDDTQQDSLVVLETKLLNEKQLLLKQEHEITDLNVYCRTLQKNLNKSLSAQENLLQHSHEQKIESEELHEFLQAEKNMLGDSLKDFENENSRLKKLCANFEGELNAKEVENKALVKTVEQKRQENLGMQARLIALEAKSRELLVHQGSTVSGAAVALTSLVTRLEGLVEELIESYNISEQDLDDVIFHNEAYSNSNCSSLDTTPDSTNRKFISTPSPKPPKTNSTPSSFVSAVINAIKNATTLATNLTSNPYLESTSRDELSATDNSDNSAELLDSETEPCLMMEHVLEDVILPDTHSHNMISSCSSLNRTLFNANNLQLLTHSESLQAIPTSNQFHLSLNQQSLLDQVIYVDNMITRLLKVIRIIQMESETYTNELLDERDNFAEQANSRKETNKIVVKQLSDWEVLGAQLKKEVELLMDKLSKKNDEMDGLKGETGNQRTEIEKLNKDVCDLSTALSKAENDSKTIDEGVSNILMQYKNSQLDEQIPSEEIISRLINSLEEIPSLKSKLVLKDKQLKDLAKEYSVNRQVLAENLKGAVSEARKQYDAIDNALETLHGIQSVVHQCPPLAKLQRDLEEVNFQSASDLPLVVVPGDYNANAAALNQPLAVANHESIATAINA